MKVFSRIKLCLLLLTLIAACKTEDEKYADQQYEEFKNTIKNNSLNVMAQLSAEYVAQNHYDPEKKMEAQQWLIAFNDKMKTIDQNLKKNLDSLRNKAEMLGYKQIELDSKTKCNLYKGYYHLNKTITDSVDLAFLAKYLANELYQSASKKPDCPYPVVSQAFIYISQEDYRNYEGGWISMCSISPQNYNGEVSVNKLLLKIKGKGVK